LSYIDTVLDTNIRKLRGRHSEGSRTRRLKANTTRFYCTMEAKCNRSRKWSVMYLCSMGINFSSLYDLYFVEFKTVPTVWYFFFIYYHSSFGYRVRRVTNLYFNVLVLISPSSYNEMCRLWHLLSFIYTI
jgi:hypothetical protein